MKKLWFVIVLLIGLTACGGESVVLPMYSEVQSRVYHDVTTKQKAEFAAKGVYSNIALNQDDVELLKHWSIEVSFEFSEDKKQYILVFLDTRNRNTSYLDQDGYMWDGVQQVGESAFQQPRKYVRKLAIKTPTSE